MILSGYLALIDSSGFGHSFAASFFPNSFCLGPRSYESPVDLISCVANRIPSVSQDIDLDSWADSLRAWPNPSKGWVSWYNRVTKTYQSTWETIGIADALFLSLSPLRRMKTF
jgi:hypothetical protein